MPNTLLNPPELPQFDDIANDEIVDAISKTTDENLRQLNERLAKSGEYSWRSIVEPVQNRDDLLAQIWSPISHLNLVRNTPELRKAHDEALAVLSNYYTAFGQKKALFEAYEKVAESDEFASYDQARKTVVEHSLRDFKLSGVHLPEDKKQRLAEINQTLSQLNSTFSNNVMDASEAWHFHAENKSELSGIPETVINLAEQTAKGKELEGYVLKLDGPTYQAVVTYAEDIKLREAFYHAWATRASDCGPNAGQFDNNTIIDEILALRHEQAQLLGMSNYAEVSVATKMALSPDEVLAFLSEITEKAKVKAEQDLSELKDWVNTEFGISDIEPWSIAFYSEKLRQAKYRISQEVLRQYFSLPKVLDGLFDIVARLFSLEITELDSVNVWHKDARFFEIRKDGEKIAAFYLDLFARDGKRGGAWMDVCRTRLKLDEGLQLPVAYLVCNFTAPTNDKPALLTHNEVTTLFHEFGHGIHHMLTQMEVAGVSGINGVEWDAVELPSQFLENWAWQPEVLKSISSHVDTGEVLSDELIEKMLAAKTFQSGLFLVRQIEFGLFDLLIHMHAGDSDFIGVQATLDDVRGRVSVIPVPDYHRFQCGFSHIFAGGYAAGYYSYLWAEVLSSDAFSMFEENGIFDVSTGLQFLNEILSRGGSEPAGVLFERFRGRKPENAAFLRHLGIA